MSDDMIDINPGVATSPLFIKMILNAHYYSKYYHQDGGGSVSLIIQDRLNKILSEISDIHEVDFFEDIEAAFRLARFVLGDRYSYFTIETAREIVNGDAMIKAAILDHDEIVDAGFGPEWTVLENSFGFGYTEAGAVTHRIILWMVSLALDANVYSDHLIKYLKAKYV